MLNLKGLESLICRLCRKHKMSASRIAKFFDGDKQELRVKPWIKFVVLYWSIKRANNSTLQRQKRGKPYVQVRTGSWPFSRAHGLDRA